MLFIGIFVKISVNFIVSSLIPRDSFPKTTIYFWLFSSFKSVKLTDFSLNVDEMILYSFNGYSAIRKNINIIINHLGDGN